MEFKCILLNTHAFQIKLDFLKIIAYLPKMFALGRQIRSEPR